MLYVLLIVIGVIVFIAIAGLVAIPIIISRQFIGRRFEQKQFDSRDVGVVSERIALKTDDHLTLAAWRTKSNNERTKGTIIILSGIMNPSVTMYFGFAKMFAEHGWDSLLVEMRARSLSEGTTTGLGMTEWLDVKAAVDYLTNDNIANALPIIAMGTSMGGGTVLTAAGELPRIDAVISMSGFAAFIDMAVEILPSFGIPKFIARMDRPFIKFVFGIRLGFGYLKYTPIKGLAKLGNRPLLLMHTTEDKEVPFSQYEKLLAEAKKYNINVTAFSREGNHHFVCYHEHMHQPMEDKDFSEAILKFLSTVSE